VRLDLEGKRGRRVAWLTRSEFRILLMSPIARAALGGAAQDTRR
jgi:hypothetical protein